MIFAWDFLDVPTFEFVLMLIGIVIAGSLILALTDPERRGREHPSSPLEILALRRRRGEIDAREYERMRNALGH